MLIEKGLPKFMDLISRNYENNRLSEYAHNIARNKIDESNLEFFSKIMAP